MFKRKSEDGKADSEAIKPRDSISAPPMKPFSKRGSHAPVPAPTRAEPAQPASTIPTRSGNVAIAPARRYQRFGDSDGRKLTIGKEISISGEITSCDKLIVEGTVEADLPNSRALEVAYGGIFRGMAKVEDADISGHFEGELIVTQRLVVRKTGQLEGTVRYAGIVIEPGGQVHGNVQVLDGVGSQEPPRLTAPKKPQL